MDVIHSIKNPAGNRLILSMTIIGMISFRNAITDATSSLMLSFLNTAVLLLSAVTLSLTLYRSLKKPTRMHLYDERIFINDHTIQAKNIQSIMMMGYFRPVLGLKLHRKRIVPPHLCFSFSEAEDKGMKDIAKWAEDNGIKIVNKSFLRWL